ncbi:hypothetical protein PoB_002349500 [Plakobranchus ocellatus]|uniref:Uncharacterized protein n=1 Tax=Plakobranchus ocellatus TaxID=259542 RepID=A0AAV3ZPA6_9GAST|nr:hypothetical protein PoB_002349500 [Plakobranchus ocellatus]
MVKGNCGSQRYWHVIMMRRLSLRRILLLLLLPSLGFLLLVTSFFSDELSISNSDASLSFAVSDIHDSGPPETPAPLDPDQRCVFPFLPLKDSLMMSFVEKPKRLYCPKEQDWVYVRNGTLIFSEEIRASVGNFTCDVMPLVRHNDDLNVTWGPPIRNFPNGSAIPVDFFKVKCERSSRVPTASSILNNFKKRLQPYIERLYVYTEVLMGVSPFNKDVWSRLQEVRPPANGLGGLSVLMLGFDSMSRIFRRLPDKTVLYGEKLLSSSGRANCGINIMPRATHKIWYCRKGRVPKNVLCSWPLWVRTSKQLDPGFACNVGSPDLAPIPIHECHTT